MKFKTRRTSLKQIIAIVLTCVVVFALGAFVIGNTYDKDTKIINPTFEVGGLDATTGKYVETDGSIYTKESFECQGLTIKLDFDSQVTYQVFYYDELDEYLGECSEVYDESVELTVPADAKYARIMVTPVWGDDVAKADRVVHWYNVLEYSTQLEISVLKDQEIVEEEVETPAA